MVKFSKFSHILPHMLKVSVENVGTIDMNINTLDFLSINITSYIITFIYNKNFFTTSISLMSKNSTKKATANH